MRICTGIRFCVRRLRGSTTSPPPVVDEDGIRYPLKYYSYVTGKIRLITERNMMNKLFYHDGSLYFWEVSGDEGQVSGDTIRHLYRYHEKTGRITRLTDEDTCYGMENSPWLMLPDMIYADDRYLYLVSYPDYYRADHDFGNLEKISVAELPKDVSVRINDVTYSLNGMLYTIPDGTNTLIGQNIETGEIEVIADAVVSFVMNENGLCYQPRYEEAEEIEGRFNRSHGQIYCYDIKSGEHTVILNEPDRHLSSAMHLSDGVLMVQIYGYSTDAHGEERYDILPDALMYKDGVWVEVRSDIR